VLLTLAPLTLAGLVTLGTCVAIGLPLNFENIIALPLLFGIGVAFSIYFVMAWRGGSKNLLQSSLTRAVLFSALTTGTAFGSLWGSHHPGTASMGKLLALSLAFTLVASLIFLPALLSLVRAAVSTALHREVAALFVCAALAGCATTPGTRDSGTTIHWNFQPTFSTRMMHSHGGHPPNGRNIERPFRNSSAIKAFVDNLQEPRIFANNLLQLRVNDAGFTFARRSTRPWVFWACSHRKRARAAQTNRRLRRNVYVGRGQRPGCFRCSTVEPA
jgi:uncharacterized membrane protein